MTRRSLPHGARAAGPRAQQGLVLLVVLVALALLLLAGAGAMRSIDSGNVIAGNFTFQRAAAQAADRSLTDAMNAAAATIAGGGGNTAVANRYYSTRQTGTDSRGFPSTIDWTSVACVDPEGASVSNCGGDSGEYRVQFVIERMCSSNPTLTDVSDIRAKCEYEASVDAVSAYNIPLRYRVITRVRGPRGTESWFEAMFSGPANSA
jgi:Tfp pilus assembly protein PilX